MATVRWLECKYATYNWRGISELQGLGPRARRGMAQLLPYSWSSLKWTAFSSEKNARTHMCTYTHTHMNTHTHT